MDHRRQRHGAMRRQQQQHQQQSHQQQQQSHEHHQLQQQYQFMTNHFAGVHHRPDNVTALAPGATAINNFGILSNGSSQDASPFVQAPYTNGSDNNACPPSLYHPGHQPFFPPSSEQQQQLHLPYQRQLTKAAALTAMDLRSAPAPFLMRQMPGQTQPSSRQGPNSSFNRLTPTAQTVTGNNFVGTASNWMKKPSSPLNAPSHSSACNEINRKNLKTQTNNNSSDPSIFSPDVKKPSKQEENLFDDDDMEAIDWDIPEPTPLPPSSEEVSKQDKCNKTNLLSSFPQYENGLETQSLNFNSPTKTVSSLSWLTSASNPSPGRTKSKKKRAASTSRKSTKSASMVGKSKVNNTTNLSKSKGKKSSSASAATTSKPTLIRVPIVVDKKKLKNTKLSSTNANTPQSKQTNDSSKKSEGHEISVETNFSNSELPVTSESDSDKGNKKNLSVLSTWVNLPQHLNHPYPSDEQKMELSELSGLNLKSLEVWFTNYRKHRWSKTKHACNKYTLEQTNDNPQSYESIRKEIEKMIGENESKTEMKEMHLLTENSQKEKNIQDNYDELRHSDIRELLSTVKIKEDIEIDSQNNETTLTTKSSKLNGRSSSDNKRISEVERRKHYVTKALLKSKYSWPESSRETFNAIVDFCRIKGYEKRPFHKEQDLLFTAVSADISCGIDECSETNEVQVKMIKDQNSSSKILPSEYFAKEKSLLDLLLLMRNNYSSSESDIVKALSNPSTIAKQESININRDKAAANEIDYSKVAENQFKNEGLFDAENQTKKITINQIKQKKSMPTSSFTQQGSAFVLLALIKVEIPQSTSLLKENNLLHKKNTISILGSATIENGGRIIRHLTSDVIGENKFLPHKSSKGKLNNRQLCSEDVSFDNNNEPFSRPIHCPKTGEMKELSIGDAEINNVNFLLYHSIESWVHNLPKIHCAMKSSPELLKSKFWTTKYNPKDMLVNGTENILLLVTSGSDENNIDINGNDISGIKTKNRSHEESSSTNANLHSLLNTAALRIPFDSDKDDTIYKNVLSLVPLSIINQKGFIDVSVNEPIFSSELMKNQNGIEKNTEILKGKELKKNLNVGGQELILNPKTTKVEATCLNQNKNNSEISHIFSQSTIDDIYKYKYESYEVESYVFLRNLIHSCFDTKDYQEEQGCNAYPIYSVTDIHYPHAPLGEIWVKTIENQSSDRSSPSKTKSPKRNSSKKIENLEDTPHNENHVETKNNRHKNWIEGNLKPLLVNSGGSLLGRRWIWDEGYFTDCDCITEFSNSDQSINFVYPSMKCYFSSKNKFQSLNPRENGPVPIYERAYCNCGKQHKGPQRQNRNLENSVSNMQPGRTRRSERSGTSVSMSHVLAELASGKLNPHTLITCDKYSVGPEFRYLVDEANFSSTVATADEIDETQSNSEKKLIGNDTGVPTTNFSEKPKFDSFNISTVLEILPNLKRSQIQPFAVRVSPDVTFLTDLHSHLSDSEIIGLLGGRYIPSERCIYIQAAFPCKSTSRTDSGYTDVEMDPVSQIIAGDAIVRYGMTVVGWYHSHPTFQPDPSVTDIENQGNYQRLFQSVNKSNSQSSIGNKKNNNVDLSPSSDVTETDSTLRESKIATEPIKLNGETTKNSGDDVIPFVGLIVGTYDGRNPTSKSVMKWFHVTKKGGSSQRLETDLLNEADPDQKAESLGRSSSSKNATKKEVYFPMNLEVTHRKFRHIQTENSIPGDNNKFKSFRRKLTASGTSIRREIDFRAFLSALQEKSDTLNKSSIFLSATSFCKQIGKTDQQSSSSPHRTSENNNPKLEKSTNSKCFMNNDMATISPKENVSDFAPSPSTSTKSTSTTHNRVTEQQFLSKGLNKKTDYDDYIDFDFLMKKNEEKTRGFLSNFSCGVELTNTIMYRSITNDPTEKREFNSSATQEETTSLTSFLYSKSYDNLDSNKSRNNEFVRVADLKNSYCDLKRKKLFHNFDDESFHPAYPLPFAAKELRILNMKLEDGVTDDIRAGIIWNAVEREQNQSAISKKSDYIQGNSTLTQMPKPASSNSILELLMLPRKPQFHSENFSNDENEDQDSHICDDAILVHTIDAVISHYACDSHKINPFESWSGAGDKGFQTIDSNSLNYDENDSLAQVNVGTSWWKEYYSDEIIGVNVSNKSTQGGSTNNYKMKRGHKITACLLGWASNMQINQRLSFNIASKFNLYFQCDNETARPSASIDFVAEIMRLLAARWRESSKKKKSSQNKNGGILRPKRKRGRPPLSSYAITSLSKNDDKNTGLVAGKKSKKYKKK